MYRASWPGCTLLVATATLTQISDVAAVGVLDELLETDQLLEAEGCDPLPGVIVGVGVLGAGGSTWHWFDEACVLAECAPAKAAAVVPTQSTATPAKTPNTEEPTRLPRCGTTALLPCWGVNSRFSITR